MMIKKVLEKCEPNTNNIIIPGSANNSDLSASIAIVKTKLKKYLLGIQKLGIPERHNEWLPMNFCNKQLV